MGEATKVDPVKLMAVAPLGTTLPTSTTAALTSFEELGEISADSLTEALNPANTKIRNARGTVIRTVQTEFEPTFQITPLTENQHTLGLYYSGSDLESTGGGRSVLKLKPIVSGDRRVIVIDTLDGDVVTRYVLPNAEVTDRGNREHKNDAGAGFPLTITAYADDDGVHAYIYYEDDLTSS